MKSRPGLVQCPTLRSFLLLLLLLHIRAAAGISQSLIRVAVGLEDIIDIKADLELGLGAL